MERKEKIVDLHTHSIYSDGCNTPEELLNMAIENNLKYFAITDHDEITGSKQLIELAKQTDEDIIVYSGVEMTAKAKKGRMHILGYNIDLENERLNKVLREQKQSAIYNILLYVEIIRKDFKLIIPEEEINKIINYVGNIGRPQLALLLVKLGYAIDVEDAFQKYLITAYEKVRSIKKGLTKEEVMDLIISAGGIPILAHPNSLKKDLIELKQEILYLKSLGLQGLETTHSNLNEEERRAYHQIAIELGLLESGGTDFHGHSVKPDIDFARGRNNNVYIPEKSLTFTDRVKSRYTRS